MPLVSASSTLPPGAARNFAGRSQVSCARAAAAVRVAGSGKATRIDRRMLPPRCQPRSLGGAGFGRGRADLDDVGDLGGLVGEVHRDAHAGDELRARGGLAGLLELRLAVELDRVLLARLVLDDEVVGVERHDGAEQVRLAAVRVRYAGDDDQRDDERDDLAGDVAHDDPPQWWPWCSTFAGESGYL